MDHNAKTQLTVEGNTGQPSLKQWFMRACTDHYSHMNIGYML